MAAVGTGVGIGVGEGVSQGAPSFVFPYLVAQNNKKERM